MRKVIYFTYSQKSKYLRFYYEPTKAIDGVIVKDGDRTGLYFTTKQANVKQSLRYIDEHYELTNFSFMEKLDDLFYFLHKPNPVNVCHVSSTLLSHLTKAKLLATS